MKPIPQIENPKGPVEIWMTHFIHFFNLALAQQKKRGPWKEDMSHAMWFLVKSWESKHGLYDR